MAKAVPPAGSIYVMLEKLWYSVHLLLVCAKALFVVRHATKATANVMIVLVIA